MKALLILLILVILIRLPSVPPTGIVAAETTSSAKKNSQPWPRNLSHSSAFGFPIFDPKISVSTQPIPSFCKSFSRE